MVLNERFREIRKEKKLSQTKFGKLLGVSRDVINNIENNRVIPSDVTIKAVCYECGISEKWLRNGEGEMYQDKHKNILKTLAKKHKLTPLQTKLLNTYMKLTAEEKGLLDEFLAAFTKSLNETKVSNFNEFLEKNKVKITEELDIES